MSERAETVVVGGGIVGLATAYALTRAGRGGVVVLEAEDRLAAHQTGNNSGVIHSGLYYKPGSLKARNCAEGREALYRFCADRGIPHERCGKVVVAASGAETPALDELERRGRANGLDGLRRLRPEEIREIEPHAAGVDGLFVPQTGIVDYKAVCEAMAASVRESGGEIRLRCRFLRARQDGPDLVLETDGGELRARTLINCGGLQSDRVARACGVAPRLKIIPFRGEYYTVRSERRSLVRNLIYPVPDPQFPFLGVHFTRTIDGRLEAGPNAVLAFRREGYTRSSFSLRDTLETFGYSGFRRMAFKHWQMGLGEFRRSFSRRLFAQALQKLVPDIGVDDLAPGGAGVRAQAVEPDGGLTDDFRLVETDRMVHVLNAPSPAATAALAIGEAIAARLPGPD